MAYVVLVLVACAAVIGFVPGLPADVGGFPVAPATASIRSLAGGAQNIAARWGGIIRTKAMGLIREQLHDAIDETVQ